jgi:hypothetical protein
MSSGLFGRVGGAELTAPGCQKKPKIYSAGNESE